MNDPAHYRACNQPHESIDAANTAVAAFDEDIKALRLKYKLPNVVIMAQFSVIGKDGEESIRAADLCHGDQNGWEAMANYLCGLLAASRQERMAKMMTAFLKKAGER
jgi:hypothetical protein